MKKLSILVVDDEIDIRLILSDYFGILGHAAKSACDGREALAMCGAETFDLIVMDYLMPAMSGLELFETLRENGLCRKVVFMSGSVQLPANVPIGDEHVITWLEKPFPLETFDRILSELAQSAE